MPVYTEQCAILRAGPMAGVHNGTTTTLDAGWVRVGLRIWPRYVNAVWCWHGSRHAQAIKRVRVEYTHHNGGHTLWFECPSCGEKTTALFLIPGGPEFRCKRCIGAIPAAWRVSGKVREPKRSGPWLKWVVRQGQKFSERSDGQ